MDHLDKLKIEQLLSDPNECGYRVMLREFFEYNVPLVCPYKTMLKAFYKRLASKEADRESGLL